MAGIKATVRIEGLRELDAALGQLTKATARNVLKRVLLKAGQPIADEAARLAPDDPKTGPPDLHTSIVVGSKLKNTTGNAEFAETMRNFGTKAEAVQALRDARRAAGGAGTSAQVYVGPASTTKRAAIKAIVQEFGSVKQAPQPYMRPAWEATKGTALEIIKRDLGGEIQKAAARAARRAAKKAAAGK